MIQILFNFVHKSMLCVLLSYKLNLFLCTVLNIVENLYDL